MAREQLQHFNAQYSDWDICSNQSFHFYSLILSGYCYLIISIEKDDDKQNSIVKALKVRDGSPLDIPQVIIGWDDELKYHVVVPDKKIVDFKEALIFAFLGALRMAGEPNALASVTGAKRDSVGGAIYSAS